MSCIKVLKSCLVLFTPRTGMRQLHSLSGYPVGDLDPCGEALFKGKGSLRCGLGTSMLGLMGACS